MGVYRLYSGDDGKSHIEELAEDALKEIRVEGARMSFAVSQREPGHFSDYHPAPFRRWDVRLIEDTTGQGHTTTYPDGYNVTLQIRPSEE